MSDNPFRRLRPIDGALILAVTACCLAARLALLDFQSLDYQNFLLPWYNLLKDGGGFAALGLSVGDYTPPYVTYLAFLTYLPIDPLYGIKLLSTLFDLILALTVFRLVLSHRDDLRAALLAAGCTLLAPTVFLNGACWAQCDSIYVSFLLLSLLSYLEKRPVGGMLWLAAAFCLKLQTVFFLPLILLLWLKRHQVRFWHFFLIPGVYLVSVLPAWFAGRPLWELLTIYLRQTGTYSYLCMNAPSLLLLIGDSTDRMVSAAAVLLTGCVVLLSLWWLWDKDYPCTGRFLVTAALWFALVIPFLLPHMHDRYFYLADVLAIVYAFYRPKRFYLPLLVIAASGYHYLWYLFLQRPFGQFISLPVMAAALLLVGYDLFVSCRKKE